jgi:hypothetical protein
MQIIIPLQQLRQSLGQRMQTHAEKHGYEKLGRVTDSRLTELLTALTTDFVSARVQHAEPTDEYLTLITKLYPHWSKETTDDFYSTVMDDFTVELITKLDDYFPEFEWHMWYQQRVGRDLLLTIGRDYRVVEWERLTKYRKKVNG